MEKSKKKKSKIQELVWGENTPEKMMKSVSRVAFVLADEYAIMFPVFPFLVAGTPAVLEMARLFFSAFRSYDQCADYEPAPSFREAREVSRHFALFFVTSPPFPIMLFPKNREGKEKCLVSCRRAMRTREGAG